MKEFNLETFIALFEEMLGMFMWPLLFIVLFVIFAFFTLLIYDRQIILRRVGISLVLGLLGGFVGLGVLLYLSVSNVSYMAGGPLDWLMVVSIYLGGAIVSTVMIYTFLGWMKAFCCTGLCAKV